MRQQSEMGNQVRGLGPLTSRSSCSAEIWMGAGALFLTSAVLFTRLISTSVPRPLPVVDMATKRSLALPRALLLGRPGPERVRVELKPPSAARLPVHRAPTAPQPGPLSCMPEMRIRFDSLSSKGKRFYRDVFKGPPRFWLQDPTSINHIGPD